MPGTSTPTALPNQALPVDLFMDRVMQAVRRHEARVRREERLTGIPHRFSYCLRETSHLTSLPVPMLRKAIRAHEITANKISGWWMVPRGQLLRLLSAARCPAY